MTPPRTRRIVAQTHRRPQRPPSVLYGWAVSANGVIPIKSDDSGSTGNPFLDAFHGIETDEMPLNGSPEGLARAYAANSWAFRCIKVRAQALAGIPLLVTTQDGEALPQHPLQKMLGPGNTRLLRDSESDLQVYGRAFWNPRLRQQRIQRLNPQTIELDADWNGLKGFSQRILGRTVAAWEPNELVYFRDYDPGDDLGGLSPLQFALKSIGITANIQKFTEAFFKNNAMPSGVLTTEQPTISKSDAERMKTDWRDKMQGVRHAFDIPLLYGGLKYMPITPNLVDLAMKELRTSEREEIAGALGVAPELVGMTEAKNFATAQEARQSLYTETVLPEMDLIVDEINLQLVPLFGDENLKVMPDYDSIEVLQESRAQITTRNQVAVSAGYMSLNEARQRDQLDPLPVDVFVIGGKAILRSDLESGNLATLNPAPAPAAPFGLNMLPAPTPRPLPAGEPPAAQRSIVEILVHGGPQDGTRIVDTSLKSSALTDLRRWQTKAAKKGPRTPFESEFIPSAIYDFVRCGLLAWDGESDRETAVKALFEFAAAQIQAADPSQATPEEFEAYWRGIGALFDAVSGAFEDSWADVPARVAAQLRENGQAGAALDLDRFLSYLEPDLAAQLTGTVETPGPLAAVVLAGAARGNDLLQQPVKDSGTSTTTIAWDVLNQAAVDWARAYSASLVRGINDTTLALFREKIAEWIEKGGTLEQLADYLEGRLSDLDMPDGWSPSKLAWATSPERARLIAQTETTVAYHEGVVTRWEQVGVSKGKWRTNQDSLVCSVCQGLNNVIGNLRQGWAHKETGTVYTLPAHPGDRCFVAPVRD